MLGQVLEELDKEQEDFRIVKVDIDENPDLAARWQVSSVPSLFFIKDGEVKDSAVGFFQNPGFSRKWQKQFPESCLQGNTSVKKGGRTK